MSVNLSRLKAAIREHERLTKKVGKTSEARRILPAGSSRARVTTANARYMRASEAWQRAEKELAEACKEALREMAVPF